VVEFSRGELVDGRLRVVPVRTIKQSSIVNCPHFIYDLEHYREDESCRCDDPNHTDMAEWGYVWDGKLWS